MAEQQSRLAIVIDSTGAQRNAEGLAGALNRMTQAGQKAADGAGKVSKATDEGSKALSSLLDKIDPVNAALNRLDDQQRQLAKFKAKGFLDTETFDDYSRKIEQTRNGLNAYASDAGKAGLSSRQLANSMRMVPAQMTDIVVSLASGQAPLTVLLQQGGQLKDMFGGIGPAAKALGSYVLGLVNPFTVAAAAAGALAVAYYQGSEEQEEFYKTLVLTGNTVGKTAAQLSDLAAQMAQSTGVTKGAASAALNQVVSSGNVAGNTLSTVTEAVVNMNKATGKSIDTLVSDFNKLSGSPLDAISKLNDEYHFLSLAVYNQIKSLQEEGNQQDAARLATETYADTMNRRAKDIQGNLGYLESAWNSLAGAAKGAWDSMLNVGREETLAQRLDAAKKKVNDQLGQYTGGGLGMPPASAAESQKQGQAEVNYLSAAINLQSDLNGVRAEGQRVEDKAIKTQQEADRVNQQYITNAQRRVKAIQQQNDFLKVGVITQEQYANNINRINEIYSDKKEAKGASGPSYRDDAAERLLLQLREQNAALAMQESTGYKIGEQQQALIKWEQQLSDLKSKGTLTADQKSLLANADILTNQYQQNAALERQIETAQKALALERARADINRTIANRMSQYSTDEMFAGGGFSQYEQQQYTQRLSLEQSYNDKISQLRQQRASATTEIAREEIDQEIQLQQQALQTELSNYDAHMQRMNDLRGNFTAGAKRAWQEYQDSAANVSAMSQQLFSNAFNGMEDALAKFVTTGKASFSDFANSVLADIARIAIRQSLVGIGNSFSGGFGSLFASGAAASVKANAKGGVYDSPSLSAYSGGVYDSPKFFAFAKGAGVFGEAGPEAIMPLKRGSDGSLGVRMVDGGQSGSARSGDVIINQTIQVSGSGDAALQRAMEEAARKGATDGAKQARQDMLQDFQNRGQGRRLLGV
ncbi:phage tail tape measure protein [Pantoea ananatis]|uniref:phage tail tape measure protein n=1 Tax=Pantoea ananas TaxID=553 RepID=UPI0025CAC1B7|nr:phage tail tape measure protein [Pantoea ananatis]MDN4134067.1 phage tail tape measure protein [Pantoea ananatis]